eukprot:1191944-Prorocentrum_minimum.AAC.2
MLRAIKWMLKAIEWMLRAAEWMLRAMRDAGSAGIFSQRTNQTQEARVYSHSGPIRRMKKRGYILTTDQSDTGSAGIFSQRTNQTHEEARVMNVPNVYLLAVLAGQREGGV